MLLQVDLSSNTLYLSMFPIVNGSYGSPTTFHRPLPTDSPLLGANSFLLHAFNHTQTQLLLETGRGRGSDLGTSFAFATLNDQKGILRVFVCSVDDGESSCEVVMEKVIWEVKPIYQSVKMQIVDNKILLIMDHSIVEANFGKGDDPTPKNLTFERNLRFLQYFDGKWFGISNFNRLCILKEELGHLIEWHFYDNDENLLYEDLVATENYLVARFSKDNETQSGVSVFAYSSKEFFNETANARILSSNNTESGNSI